MWNPYVLGVARKRQRPPGGKLNFTAGGKMNLSSAGTTGTEAVKFQSLHAYEKSYPVKDTNRLKLEFTTLTPNYRHHNSRLDEIINTREGQTIRKNVWDQPSRRYTIGQQDMDPRPRSMDKLNPPGMQPIVRPPAAIGDEPLTDIQMVARQFAGHLKAAMDHFMLNPAATHPPKGFGEVIKALSIRERAFILDDVRKTLRANVDAQFLIRSSTQLKISPAAVAAAFATLNTLLDQPVCLRVYGLTPQEWQQFNADPSKYPSGLYYDRSTLNIDDDAGSFPVGAADVPELSGKIVKPSTEKATTKFIEPLAEKAKRGDPYGPHPDYPRWYFDMDKLVKEVGIDPIERGFGFWRHRMFIDELDRLGQSVRTPDGKVDDKKLDDLMEAYVEYYRKEKMPRNIDADQESDEEKEEEEKHDEPGDDDDGDDGDGGPGAMDKANAQLVADVDDMSMVHAIQLCDDTTAVIKIALSKKKPFEPIPMPPMPPMPPPFPDVNKPRPDPMPTRSAQPLPTPSSSSMSSSSTNIVYIYTPYGPAYDPGIRYTSMRIGKTALERVKAYMEDRDITDPLVLLAAPHSADEQLFKAIYGPNKKYPDRADNKKRDKYVGRLYSIVHILVKAPTSRTPRSPSSPSDMDIATPLPSNPKEGEAGYIHVVQRQPSLQVKDGDDKQIAVYSPPNKPMTVAQAKTVLADNIDRIDASVRALAQRKDTNNLRKKDKYSIKRLYVAASKYAANDTLPIAARDEYKRIAATLAADHSQHLTGNKKNVSSLNRVESQFSTPLKVRDNDIARTIADSLSVEPVRRLLFATDDADQSGKGFEVLKKPSDSVLNVEVVDIPKLQAVKTQKFTKTQPVPDGTFYVPPAPNRIKKRKLTYIPDRWGRRPLQSIAVKKRKSLPTALTKELVDPGSTHVHGGKRTIMGAVIETPCTKPIVNQFYSDSAAQMSTTCSKPSKYKLSPAGTNPKAKKMARKMRSMTPKGFGRR
jgi:hypothetical protein